MDYQLMEQAMESFYVHMKSQSECLRDRCVESATRISTEVKTIYDNFRKNKSRSDFNHNEVEIQKFSRKELRSLHGRQLERVKSHCVSGTFRASSETQKAISAITRIISQFDDMKKSLDEILDEHSECERMITNMLKVPSNDRTSI